MSYTKDQLIRLERIRQYRAKYRAKNIDIIKARQSVIETCICGCKITHINMNRHTRSQKHFDLICKKYDK